MTSLIIPGDDLPIASTSDIIIGPGLHSDPITKEIIPVSAGLLQSSSKTTYIETNSTRYIPSVNDYVIGIVTGVYGENFKVALSNFSFAASLSAMAFPNATKKSRPNLKVGNLIYARVSTASPEIDIEIECLDPTTGKDGGFGLLEGGFVVDVSLAFARDLLFNSNHQLLTHLVKKCKFEIAIGLNGKVWIRADNLKHTLAASNAIKNAQYVTSSDFNKVINESFKKLDL